MAEPKGVMEMIREAKKVGEEMGLTGKDLQKFVEGVKKDEKERLESEKRDERERLKLEQAKMESEKKDERERLKLEQEHDLKMAEIKAKEKIAELEAQSKAKETPVMPTKDLFKVGKFDPDKEDFETYIKGFELMVRSRKIEEDQWASVLRLHLEGEVAAEIDRMEIEDALNYSKVKEVLMLRYRLTEEGYRWRFRNSKPEQRNNERPDQYITRIKGFLNKWIDLTKAEKTYEGLFDLILREQFTRMCPKEMITYLKDKKCKKIEEVIDWSKHYVKIHGTKAFHGQSSGNHQSQRQKGSSHFKSNGGSSGNGARRSGGNYGVGEKAKYQPSSKNFETRATTGRESHEKQRFEERKTSSRLQCFQCGGNHKVRFCREKRSPEVAQAMKVSKPQDPGLLIPEPPRVPAGTNLQLRWEAKWICPETEGQGQSKEQAGACLEIVSSRDEDHIFYPRSVEALPRLSMAYDSVSAMNHRMPVSTGRLMPANTPVAVLRDTGCSTCVIRSDLVDPKQLTGRYQSVLLIDGTERRYPVARIEVDSPYFRGETEALCIPNSISEVVIGNIEGARDAGNPDYHWKPVPNEEAENDDGLPEEPEVPEEASEHGEIGNLAEDPDEDQEMPCRTVGDGTNREMLKPEPDREPNDGDQAQSAAMETRAQKRLKQDGMKQLKVSKSIPMVEPAELKREQLRDEGLGHLWAKAKAPDQDNSKYIFKEEDGWLVRQLRDPDQPKEGTGPKLLVIPAKYREKIMKVAHESLASGHMGINNTITKIQTQFFWPGLSGDVSRFCRSCEICQKTIDKGRVPKAPLGRMPIMEVPFQRIAVDLVGPFKPASERGHRWILTVIDYATRYPEAIPLKSTTTIEIAEALLTVYSRVGFPYEILSDLGTNFISELMREVARLISVKQLTTTRYHPQCNGLCEKYNGIIKKILKRMCAEQPRQWDRYLPALMFAIRETPNSSLGFSPFELLYGRHVRGPMRIIREMWTNQEPDEGAKDEYQYITELKERLSETWKLARESLQEMAGKYKKHFDKKAKPRKLKQGDKVLVLLPTDNNKLLLHWKGPYEVKGIKHENDYVIAIDGNEKTFHINMLKRYFDREPEVQIAGYFESMVPQGRAEEEREDPDIDEISDEGIEVMPSTEQTQYVRDIDVNPSLTDKQKEEVQRILYRFQDIFTDVPKKTTVAECTIELTSEEPIRSRPYQVPQSMRATIRKEVDEMLRLGIIEESNSPYGHPIVMVKKSDGSNRFCIDFRKMNKVTVFNPEPIPNPQDLFSGFTKGKYFTKIDLTKGYWQLPVRRADQEKTAFITPDGRYQFRYMPYGLVTAGAQFTKMMRKVLKGISNVANYIDDTLIFNETWEEHLQTLIQVLTRIREANLAVKPKKCIVGYKSIEFLGHQIGEGKMKTNPQLVRRISEAPRPVTKKQVRSFLGLTGFYRNYIDRYAEKAIHLTMLTGKGMPDKVKWGESQEKAFQELKKSLEEEPILHLPDFNKTFILKVDASDTGLGAALMQEFDGKLFPIAYASKKLLERERNYATVEKECLAIVWGVKRFEYFLFGRYFQIHTDHQPLVYLDAKKTVNKRLMRWAMVLQSHRFRLVSIKGSANVAADYLSRSPNL